MMKTLKIAFAALFALTLAACATPQPTADLTPPPKAQVKDPKFDLESGKPRRR
jgi:uncharacterized lipoprotein YajG